MRNRGFGIFMLKMFGGLNLKMFEQRYGSKDIIRFFDSSIQGK
jgi:hypothetical protein